MNAYDEATALMKVTGSTGATVTYERRMADGTLVVEETATVTREDEGA